MGRGTFAIAFMLVALAAGCSTRPPARTAEATASPTTNASCDRTPFDLSHDRAAIAQIRSKYPDLSDDLAAFTVSLLPPDFFETAGVKAIAGRSPTGASVAYDHGALVLSAGADVAPAEFAHDIVEAVTIGVITRSVTSSDPPILPAYTLGADTYIKLVAARPELARGPHTRSHGYLLHVQSRLRGQTRVTPDTVRADTLAAAPDYMAMFARYVGGDAYVLDQSSGTWAMHPPVPSAQATTMDGQLFNCPA